MTTYLENSGTRELAAHATGDTGKYSGLRGRDISGKNIASLNDLLTAVVL